LRFWDVASRLCVQQNNLGADVTKAECIRELYKTGEYTTAQIADVVGCREEYVRAVRQRTNESGQPQCTPADTAYYKRRGADPNYRKWRSDLQCEQYHNNPKYRERQLAACRKWYAKSRKRAAEVRTP
jgi:hypothetical protein